MIKKLCKANKKLISIYLLLSVIAIVSFSFNRISSSKMTGVYWGAFNPITEAHAAIIKASLGDIKLKKLIIVVNNHSYKKYSYPLEVRLQTLKEIIQFTDLENVELLSQDDTNKLDFSALRKITSDPICAIAGYDSYKKWVEYSTPEERLFYDAIAVIPRGDEPPILFDEHAFILPINSLYKDISSSKVRDSSINRQNNYIFHF